MSITGISCEVQMLMRRLLSEVFRSRSRLFSEASTCCKVPKPQNRSLAKDRPDLDFDYLLDKSNKAEIKENITNRKGVGDIEQVHSLWNQIQSYGERADKKLEQFEELWDNFYQECLKIPNRTDPNVPIGSEENARLVGHFGAEQRVEDGLHNAETLIKGWKSVFYPRDTCGSRSYAFLGSVANIEAALLKHATCVVKELQTEFKEIRVNDILPLTTTEACGTQPKSSLNHTLQYLIKENNRLCLSGTAEMGIAHELKGKRFNSAKPHYFMAQSRCFRPEISHSASEAKLYRVHEFNKVEMFVVCTPNQSSQVLEELVSIQKEVFSRLGLHFRVLDMPSQELGASATRKFDLEVWMPGRSSFGEISSASNCLDYQTRRLDIKIRQETGEMGPAHTCNATALSSTRALIAVLETHQEPKRKSWTAPESLKKFLPTKRSTPLSTNAAKKSIYNFD